MNPDLKHKLLLFNEIVLCVMAISMLLISVTLYTKMKTDGGTPNQVIEDWKRPPLTDIKIVQNTIDNQQHCPEEYTEMFTYLWPGTLAGCSCLDINSTIIEDPIHRNAVFPRSCTFNETLAGCVKINALKEKSLSPIENVRICGKE